MGADLLCTGYLLAQRISLVYITKYLSFQWGVNGGLAPICVSLEGHLLAEAVFILIQSGDSDGNGDVNGDGYYIAGDGNMQVLVDVGDVLLSEQNMKISTFLISNAVFSN